MAEVEAAGCVVWRERSDSVEFLVAHRPRYDDWSFPKGKLDDGETFQEAALRELDEETGARGSLGAELPSTSYVDHKGRSKIVRYWLVEAEDPHTEAADFQPNDEVDQIVWSDPGAAAEMLSYEHDAQLLAEAVALLSKR